MGGKNKQRTKNNVRPSSSGRSAELLTNKAFDNGVPALFQSLSTPILDLITSPELQLCFKKLSKKDPITKSKALQELSELVTQSKVDDVVATLSSWSHYYRLLSIDPDRKVREMTQLCHGSIVSVCGRRVAPALRSMMATWLQAQYDDHAPARAQAERSLHATFPENKLPEVLSFCKEEIVSYLLENLSVNGEAAVIKKSSSPEEVASGVARHVSSSLRGVQYVCVRLDAAHDAWLWPRLDEALAAALWWKRATAADVAVRAAWYGAMTRIVERFATQFAEKYGPKLLRIAIGNREVNPVVASELWDCLLVFMHGVQDWHQYLEKKELLSKRILDLLENGGWGDARHLSNVSLPLLANLPPEVLAEDFYVAFFDALFDGLEKKAILSSKSERQCWIKCCEECVRYVSLRAEAGGARAASGALRRWLRAAAARAPLAAPSARAMAALLRRWQRQPRLDLLVRNYWQHLNATVAAELDAATDDLERVGPALETHVALLLGLDDGFADAPEKRKGVRFADEPEEAPAGEEEAPAGEEEPPPEEEEAPSEGSPDAGELRRFRHNLSECVRETCARYVRLADSRRAARRVLPGLAPLLDRFASADLFEYVARSLAGTDVDGLYERVLRRWLEDEEMRCRPLARLAFLALEHATDEGRTFAFESFEKMPAEVGEWCLELADESPAAARWAGGERAGAALCALASRGAAGDERAAALLLRRLAAADHETARAVCRHVAAELAGGGARTAARVALAARVLEAAPDSPELALALFEAGAGGRRAARAAGEHERRRCVAALHRRLGLGSNVPDDGDRSPAPPDSEPNLPADNDGDDEKVAGVALGALRRAAAACAELALAEDAPDAEKVARFTEVVLDVPPTDPMEVEAFALRSDILLGRLNCLFDDNILVKAIVDDRLGELTKDNFISYINKVLFRSLYLSRVLSAAPQLALTARGCSELCQLLRQRAVLRSLHRGYGFWPHYEIIRKTTSIVESLLEDIIDGMSTPTKKHILHSLSLSAASEGYYWAFAKADMETALESSAVDDNPVESRVLQKKDECDQTESKDQGDGNEPSVEGNPEREGHDEGKRRDEEKRNETEHLDRKERDSVDGDDFVSLLNVDNIQEIITGDGFFHTMEAARAGAAQYAAAVRALAAQHAAELAGLLAAPHAHRLDPLLDLYYRHNDVMLYDTELRGASWPAAVSNACLLRYLAGELEGNGWFAPQHHWDFVTITLCSLLNSMAKSKRDWGACKVALVGRAALQLFARVADFVGGVRARCERVQPAPHVAHLPAEWEDIFAPDTHTNLFAFILHVLETCEDAEVDACRAAVLSALVEACGRMRWAALPAVHRGEEELRRLAAAASAALTGPAPLAFKYLAYETLTLLIDPMVLDDAGRLAAWSEAAEAGGEEAPPPALSLAQYARTLQPAAARLRSALQHLRLVEESVSPRAGSPLEAQCAGVLLLADVLHAHCRRARHDLAYHYNAIYREKDYAEEVMNVALRLLPASVLPGEEQSSPLHAALFTGVPPRDIYRGAEVVGGAACACVCACARGVGAVWLRKCRAAAAPRLAAALDHIVSRYVTPILVKEEFALLQRKASEIEDSEVRSSVGARTAWCRVSVEERELELVVTLARTHPLLAADISAPPPAQRTQWLQLYLAYQCGSVYGAMRMWAETLRGRVRRAAQCYICYCRLHPASGRLPSVTCYQCKNKFHNPCLRKWFRSSNKSNCPLCRSKF